MKRVFALLGVLALLIPAAAFGLSQSSIPPKFGIAWGNSAGAAYIRSIPTTSQIGIQNCAASLPDGFPPLTFTPSSAGGCPPFGQDFNGILKQLSQWNQWQSAGGPVFYDAGFSTSIGGYPNGAILNSAIVPGYRWMSTADNNASSPDAGGANWVQDPGQVPTGTPVPSLSTTIPSGYVSANGTTIGNASSNGTNRANGDTLFLFVFVWNNCPNSACPIFTSTGSVSTRGGSCTITTCADYAANKAIAVQNLNGTGLIGADSQNGTTSTNLTGVPVTSGARTTPGSVLGENLHALTSGENGPHTHTITDPGHTHQFNFQSNTLAGVGTGAVTAMTSPFTGTTTNSTTGISINSSGSGTGHNTVERSMIAYYNLKL